MKPIAVVSDNWSNTVRWLQDTRKIINMNMSQKTLYDDCDNTYVVINRADEVAGWEFSDVIVDPKYRSLERYCRDRIK